MSTEDTSAKRTQVADEQIAIAVEMLFERINADATEMMFPARDELRTIIRKASMGVAWGEKSERFNCATDSAPSPAQEQPVVASVEEVIKWASSEIRVKAVNHDGYWPIEARPIIREAINRALATASSPSDDTKRLDWLEEHDYDWRSLEFSDQGIRCGIDAARAEKASPSVTPEAQS